MSASSNNKLPSDVNYNPEGSFFKTALRFNGQAVSCHIGESLLLFPE